MDGVKWTMWVRIMSLTIRSYIDCELMSMEVIARWFRRWMGGKVKRPSALVSIDHDDQGQKDAAELRLHRLRLFDRYM